MTQMTRNPLRRSGIGIGPRGTSSSLSSSSRCSRLLLLGALMALLYGLFASLALSLVGSSSSFLDQPLQLQSASPGVVDKQKIARGGREKILGGKAILAVDINMNENAEFGKTEKGETNAENDDGNIIEDLDDGRAEAGANANEEDINKRLKRTFVKPAGMQTIDDDDDDDDDEKDDGGTGQFVADAHEHGTQAIFGRANIRDESRVLKAYIEPIDQEKWKIKPLPVRETSASKLKVKEYKDVTSCRKLPEQFPINEPPTDEDPYLPWIHDIFPTADGKYIQFVAQNRRRCQSGKDFAELKKFLQPNVALFQHVPVKRIEFNGDNGTSPSPDTRYRLSSHEEADPDGVATRFICRFSTGQETLSVFNFDYDYHTYRKRYKATFTEEGFDVHMIWSSQLLFKCPVPPELVETIKAGSSVVNDRATLFVDLVPIRTQPRYGPPTEFLQPRYKGVPKVDELELDADEIWGKNHILPRVEDSGRWANIPICKPSLMQFVAEHDKSDGSKAISLRKNADDGDNTAADGDYMADGKDEGKQWNAIMCTWTSASFYTRGERRHITDNIHRIREWTKFHFMTGFDHLVIYDNSEAQEHADSTLEHVTDLFPGKVTRINWPCKVCNNRPGTGDNKGERSSQYAAESSCRLRFGAHSKWLTSLDVDEYLVPMHRYFSFKDLLKDVEKDGTKILTFQSMRAWPRMNLLEEPKKFTDAKCPESCFHPTVRNDLTFLQTYNCDQEKPPRKNLMPAEKQIYQPEYVLLHFVHYSTVTTVSQLSKEEAEAANIKWSRGYKEAAAKVVDEEKEATMLHTKSVAWDQTRKWERACKLNNPVCKVGFPFPEGKDRSDGVLKDDSGFTYNCFVNKKIENFWVPELEKALRSVDAA